jgi:hypothetical protein
MGETRRWARKPLAAWSLAVATLVVLAAALVLLGLNASRLNAGGIGFYGLLSQRPGATAELATALSGRYRLKAADATHLATAVGMGADRFITSNKRDFPLTITEVQVTYPADLA